MKESFEMHSKNAVQKKNNLANYLSGLKTGIPIALGYFAVSLSLGISAKSAGLSPFHASAGEYAAFTLISASASYVEIAIM